MGILGQGGNVMTNTKALKRSACVGAILAATTMSGASAQQTIAPASATPVPGPMPEILRAYAPVTAERLKKPEDGNWLMFRRTFDGWGYSPLDEINRENVSRLQPVWSFATGQVEGHQAPPIVWPRRGTNCSPWKPRAARYSGAISAPSPRT
jgi:alcohol dehydrogenase (cytochrome c)